METDPIVLQGLNKIYQNHQKSKKARAHNDNMTKQQALKLRKRHKKYTSKIKSKILPEHDWANISPFKERRHWY